MVYVDDHDHDHDHVDVDDDYYQYYDENNDDDVPHIYSAVAVLSCCTFLKPPPLSNAATVTKQLHADEAAVAPDPSRHGMVGTI
eukprot:5630462-Amphidinium_carterae.1